MYHNNNLFYSSYELMQNSLIPFRNWAKLQYFFAKAFTYPFSNFVAANQEMFERMTQSYSKPKFLIKDVILENNSSFLIKEKNILAKSFCNLTYFEKLGNNPENRPKEKLLIVAPMAGHYATLLRETVRGLLPYYDVYITEWINPSEVPLSLGHFDLNDYIDYIVEFMEHLSPNLNILAVCQPTVPVLCAAAYMADMKKNKTPKTLTLIGGPIDTRINPTEVNKFATKTKISWFKKHLINIVPVNKPGFMRRVYPGILQLASFVSMNLARHTESHMEIYDHLVNNQLPEATRKKAFYDEYLSVMDLTEEFFLQTVETIFQKQALARGNFYYRDYKIDPGKITNIGILGIEGEKDDITGIGQTKAGLDLCINLTNDQKKYHLQKDVGHYGVFSGSKFKQYVIPVIRDFIGKF